MQSVTRSLLLAVLVMFTSVSVAQSSQILQVFRGETAKDGFGYSVASAGDVNNDGFDDIIVGAPDNNAGGERAGRVYVFSGLNGDTLYIFTGEAPFDQLGLSVAGAGDVNADGYADLILGAPNNKANGLDFGRAYVYSGFNGDTLHVFNGESANEHFGSSVAFAGDVNNDGFDDIIVGISTLDNSPGLINKAYLFSGQNGNPIRVFSGDTATSFDFAGVQVASAGDVNNDGFADMIVSSWRNSSGILYNGAVSVLSGQNNDTLYSFAGDMRGENLGRSVAPAGDVNQDGFADFIVGAPGYSNYLGENVGRALVISGQNGDTLFAFTGEAIENFFGTSVASVGDINNDGFIDLMVGAPINSKYRNQAGRAYVFSGLTGGTLHVFTGEAALDWFGSSVASAGDVNNDGTPDLIIGAPRGSSGSSINSPRSKVYVFSGVPAESCCLGLTGSVDGDPGDLVNITDLTFLIDHLFINFPAIPCPAEGNINGDLDGVVDITDLTFLVDHLFINFPATAPCNQQ